MDRSTFLALCEAEDPERSYTRRDVDGSVFLAGKYRMFARWFDGGAQPGIHLRCNAPQADDVPSEAFQKGDNWVWVTPGPDLADRIAHAREVAAMRFAGKTQRALWKPLEKAVALLDEAPEGLHKGGPRAKIPSGEAECCAAVCWFCIEATSTLHPDDPDETALFEELFAVVEKPGLADWSQSFKLANTVRYGTDKEKRDAEATESARVQAARAHIGCNMFGAMSAPSYATKGLVRATAAVLEERRGDAAAAFLTEIDRIICCHELDYSAQKWAKQPLVVDEVLWRGANPKGYPAFWIARRGETWFFLGKLGRKWTLVEGDRDAALGSVPEALLGDAVQWVLA